MDRDLREPLLSRQESGYQSLIPSRAVMSSPPIAKSDDLPSTGRTTSDDIPRLSLENSRPSSEHSKLLAAPTLRKTFSPLSALGLGFRHGLLEMLQRFPSITFL